MKITKIQSFQNNNQSSINAENANHSSVRLRGGAVRQNANAQPSFQGLGAFVSRLLRKNRAPSFIASEAEVIRTLAGQQTSGAYGLTSKGYKPISGEEFSALTKEKSVSEIIIKQARQLTLCDTNVSSNKYISRNGVAPSAVIDAIDMGFRKMTFITDSERHVLTLPERNLTDALEAFEDTGHIIAELEDTVEIIPEKRAGWLYEHTQKMLEETSAINHGIKLEKFPLNEVVQITA